MHQVYGVKNWISDCLAYLQNFLQKGLKSSALPLTKSQGIKARKNTSNGFDLISAIIFLDIV